MKKNSRTQKQKPSPWLWIIPLLLLLVVGFLFSGGKHSHSKESKDHGDSAHTDGTGTLHDSPADVVKRTRLRSEKDPLARFDYIYDKSRNGEVMASTGFDKNFIPDTDVATGRDLWIRDKDGKERLVSESTYRAKFSPDGTKIAYTTSDAVLHIETINGDRIAEVPGAYDPDWKSDSTAVAFAKVPEGLPHHIPGALELAIVDVASGKTKELTNGQFDDVRPHFSPTDDWILFVSGGRSGLASFWKVPVEGGIPEQVTNVGLNEVNDTFVPTPYSRSGWSPDKRWFIYDFKSGDREEVWGLEFDKDGKFKEGRRIAEGVDPRWQEDGSFTVVQNDGEHKDLVQHKLP